MAGDLANRSRSDRPPPRDSTRTAPRRRSRRRLATAVVLLLFGGLSLPPAMRFLTHFLTYHPRKGQTATPADAGLAFESVELAAEDGVRVTAWWIPRPGTDRVLLFLHGNAGNLSGRVERVHELQALGASVLALDYRGYGLSDGRPSPVGLVLDARAAWDHLVEVRGVAPHEIVVFGSSLGAAVALELAGATRPARVVLEAPFLSIRDMAREMVPFLPRFLVPDWHDNRAAIRRVTTDVTIFHGTADEVVPFEHGRALAREGQRVTFHRVPDAGHIVLAEEVSRAAIARFRALVREPSASPGGSSW